MALILVVDDDTAVREVLSDMVVEMGHEVLSAHSASQALQLTGAMAIDLVLVDILMPDMDGLELIKALRAMAKPPRIIAISGGSRGMDSTYLLNLAAKFNADACLPKPVRLEPLSENINRFISA